MSSNATFTIEESSTTMNWPRQTTASAIQARRETVGWVASAVIDRHCTKDHPHLYDDPLMVLRFPCNGHRPCTGSDGPPHAAGEGRLPPQRRGSPRHAPALVRRAVVPQRPRRRLAA